MRVSACVAVGDWKFMLANRRNRDRLTRMDERSDLSYMANLYMALADQTRLRLLLKMYGGEVCVADFTDALGDSQPKVSRHLAYLRNAGIVNTRREGKWIHYSIRWPEEEGGRETLRAALQWLANGRGADEMSRIDVGASKSRPVEESYPIDIYADADVNENQTLENRSNSAHNELEEFLL